MRKVAYLVSAIVLTGCGGGGDDSPNPNPTAVVSDPAITFTASRTKALIDEPITLSWTSVNANNCTLNDSAVSTKGSQTFTYLSAGDRQFKLSCIGTNKSIAETITVSINPANTNSLDTDVNNIVYYDSYLKSTNDSTDLEQDKCNLDPKRITYPKTYLGNRHLPLYSGDKLKPNIQRLIYIKDAMGSNNPAEIPGCTGDLKKELLETLQRVKSLGADWVALPQWQWVGQRSDGTWYIQSTEQSSNGAARLNDEEFSFAVREAKKLGLKVFTWNQIQGLMPDNHNGPGLQPDNTFENQKRFFSAFREYFKKRVEFFESLGVDAIELSCVGCIRAAIDHKGEHDRIQHMREQYSLMVNDIKSYSGLVFFMDQSWLKETPIVYNRVDVIFAGFHIPPMTQQQEDNLTVEQMKSIMLDSVKSLRENYSSSGKYIFISTGASSRRGAYVGDNTTHVDEICPADKTNCEIDKWKTDFALQAIYHEAAFQALNQANLGPKVFAGVSDMLITDNLTPYMIYPNVMSSIRNKPAEGLVRQWFQR